MKLLKMTDPLCNVYSLAMATDTSVQDVLDEFHLHEDLGIHICELQIAALKLGYAGVLLSRTCELDVRGRMRNVQIPFDEMIMYHDRTILFNPRALHAYACDGDEVYDPNGYKFDLEIGWLKSKIEFALLLYRICES